MLSSWLDSSYRCVRVDQRPMGRGVGIIWPLAKHPHFLPIHFCSVSVIQIPRISRWYRFQFPNSGAVLQTVWQFLAHHPYPYPYPCPYRLPPRKVYNWVCKNLTIGPVTRMGHLTLRAPSTRDYANASRLIRYSAREINVYVTIYMRRQSFITDKLCLLSHQHTWDSAEEYDKNC